MPPAAFFPNRSDARPVQPLGPTAGKKAGRGHAGPKPEFEIGKIQTMGEAEVECPKFFDTNSYGIEKDGKKIY